MTSSENPPPPSGYQTEDRESLANFASASPVARVPPNTPVSAPRQNGVISRPSEDFATVNEDLPLLGDLDADVSVQQAVLASKPLYQKNFFAPTPPATPFSQGSPTAASGTTATSETPYKFYVPDGMSLSFDDGNAMPIIPHGFATLSINCPVSVPNQGLTPKDGIKAPAPSPACLAYHSLRRPKEEAVEGTQLQTHLTVRVAAQKLEDWKEATDTSP
eukprot:Filipodium_phascolosomae@DN953_c0_g1_i1.p1